MLTPSRAESLALEALARAGARRTAIALEEIAAAEERTARMEAERDAMSWLRREGRAAIEGDNAGQRDVIEGWSADAAGEAVRETELRAPERPVARERPERVDRDRVRGALFEPIDEAWNSSDRRPEGFDAREKWLRDAADLVAHGRPRPPHWMDDTGLDR